MGRYKPKQPYVEPPDFGEVKYGERLVHLTDGIVEVIGFDKDGLLRVKVLHTFKRSPLSGMEGSYYAMTPPTDKAYWHWKRIDDYLKELVTLAEASAESGDTVSANVYIDQAEEIEKWRQR